MFFTTQFHVKEQGAAKPIHGRSRRQDESVSKKVLDIDRRFIDVFSVSCMLRDVHVATVFVSLWPIAYSPFAICHGSNRPIVSRCYEPVAEHWSLPPFSINPNSCLVP